MTEMSTVEDLSTASPPDSARGAVPALRSDAERVTAALRSTITQAGLADADAAGTLLNVTPSTVMDMVCGGDLDGVVVAGQVWVDPVTLQLRAVERAELGAVRTREARSLARLALRHFLAGRPVTGSWAAARQECRPLVCRRRGQNWLRFGIEHHHVVLNARWVARWVADVGVVGLPELAAMPVGPHLRALLEDLPGVEAATSATPLLEDGSGEAARPHGLSGWVRVDPQVWALTVPAEVAAAVAAPAPVQP